MAEEKKDKKWMKKDSLKKETSVPGKKEDKKKHRSAKDVRGKFYGSKD